MIPPLLALAVVVGGVLVLIGTSHLIERIEHMANVPTPTVQTETGLRLEARFVAGDPRDVRIELFLPKDPEQREAAQKEATRILDGVRARRAFGNCQRGLA